MPNFLERLRFGNIFGSPPMTGVMDSPISGGISGQMPLPGGLSSPIDFGQSDIDFTNPSPPMMDDIAQRMRGLYQPETEATNRFNTMINEYPEYEKPGWLRAIAGSLAALGGGGHETGMQIMNQPYEQKLARWKNLIGPAQQAASLERQSNVNERTMAYQTISQQLRQEADAERAKNNERNAEIRQQRADIYEFKAKNPNLRLIFTKGGNIQTFDPQSGQTSDTGIPTGSLSESDKLSLQQSNELEQISVRTTGQKELEEMKQTGRETLAETRGWQIFNIPDPDNPGQMKAVKINQITGEVQPVATKGPISRVSTSGGIESPNQIKANEFNKARELANTNPELAKFIEFSGTNDFRITSPSTGFFGSRGPTPEQYKTITEAIYGSRKPTKLPTGRSTSIETKLNVPPGRVAVTGPDGKPYSVPINQLQEAIKQGYREIK